MEQKLRFPDATSNVSHATKSKSRLRLPTAAADGESVGEEEREGEARIRRRCRKRPSYVTGGRRNPLYREIDTYMDRLPTAATGGARATRAMVSARGPLTFATP